MNWIKVSDRLPSDDEDYNLESVLVATNRIDGIKERYIFVAHYNAGEQRWYCDDFRKLKFGYSSDDIIRGLHCVTHWMPMIDFPSAED